MLIPITDIHKVRELESELSRLTFGVNRFPGAQPVSLGREHLAELGPHTHLVCEKTDGVRYLLMITGEGVPVFVDRNMHFYTVREYRNTEDIKSSVFDGELVVHIANRDSRFQRTDFLVFDALCVSKNPIHRMHLIMRRRWCENAIPIHTYTPNRIRITGIHVLFKPMKWAHEASRVLAEPLPYETDGLIFTRVEAPYTPGTCRSMLKWKPIHINSIDFGIGRDARGAYELYVSNRGEIQGFGAHIELSDEQQRAYACIPSMPVAECVLINGAWRVMRFRGDKPLPNDVSTVHRVLDTIRNPVTEEMLCARLSGA